MKVFGLAGWSGSGKTTLMVRLLRELNGRGVTVSTVKHAHHHFDVDKPGKDSYEHRAAGAHEVMVTSARRWALMHDYGDEPEATLEVLIERLDPVDLLLIEGFKNQGHQKLEVYRRAGGKPLLAPDDPQVVAVASDGPLPEVKVPVLDLNDVAAIADFILDHCGIGGRGRARGAA
jgi:molybdopterin-guanine dinucleotide biosynthesis protein B